MYVGNLLRLICFAAVRSSVGMHVLYLLDGSSCNLARNHGMMQPARMPLSFRDHHCRIVQVKFTDALYGAPSKDFPDGVWRFGRAGNPAKPLLVRACS